MILFHPFPCLCLPVPNLNFPIFRSRSWVLPFSLPSSKLQSMFSNVIESANVEYSCPMPIPFPLSTSLLYQIAGYFLRGDRECKRVLFPIPFPSPSFLYKTAGYVLRGDGERECGLPLPFHSLIPFFSLPDCRVCSQR